MTPLLSLSDAAARLGLTKASLRTEIKKGRLTPISIAGKFYVTETLLTEFLCRAQRVHACTSDAAKADPPSGVILSTMRFIASSNVTARAPTLAFDL